MSSQHPQGDVQQLEGGKVRQHRGGGGPGPARGLAPERPLTPKVCTAYNKHHRKLYHCQGKAAQKHRFKRERERYHSLKGDLKKQRNKQ